MRCHGAHRRVIRDLCATIGQRDGSRRTQPALRTFLLDLLILLRRSFRFLSIFASFFCLRSSLIFLYPAAIFASLLLSRSNLALAAFSSLITSRFFASSLRFLLARSSLALLTRIALADTSFFLAFEARSLACCLRFTLRSFFAALILRAQV